MKISELHSLIGRPTFNIGDRVRIKETKQIGWVSHLTVCYSVPAYWFSIADENGHFINGTGTNSTFQEEDLVFADHAEAMDELWTYLKDSRNGWDLIDEAKQQAIS